MEYDFKEVLDIGLEIEFSNIKRETPNFVANLNRYLSNFRHVHDASSETPELTLGNIPLQFDVNGKTNKLLSIVRNKNFEILGGELNSPIMSGNDFRTHIYRLMEFLIDMGESFSTTEQDNRGSIHVHVNVSKDVTHKHLIRLLELGLATEAIFYRLGGMGRVNRGIKNNFIYQRPITMPPCVYCNSKYYPIFDYVDLLNSKSKTDFYNKYGDSITQIMHGNHYTTQRYTGLNFYSIPYRGSIEFRYANKVLIPEWIISWVILCQSFVNYALSTEKDNSFENIYRKLEDNRKIPDEEFLFILDKLNISEDYKTTLLDIWRQSIVPEFNGIHILTHLQNPSFFTRDIEYLPNPVKTANKCDVPDVRNIANEKSRTLSSIQDDRYKELDYVIDSSGVKTKLKDFGFNIEANIFNNERVPINDAIIHNYLLAGFNITAYTDADVINLIERMINNDKFLPFAVLHSGFVYESSTQYEDLFITFRISQNKERVEITFIDEDGNESVPQVIRTIYSENFNCRGYNFHDIIRHCNNNPDVYFNPHHAENNNHEILHFEEDNPEDVVNEPPVNNVRLREVIENFGNRIRPNNPPQQNIQEDNGNERR